MKRLTLVLFLLLTCLVPTFAQADALVVGHMTPLPSEILDKPITLPDCPGLTIAEWRGTKPTIVQRIRLNSLCQLAMSKFEPFLASKNLHKQNNKPFKWGMSIIPDGTCYRCMNDISHRFAARWIKEPLYGYASEPDHWSFTINNTSDVFYFKIFTHELFHSMSMHYGVFHAHHTSDAFREMMDENLAQDFTEYLGFGR